MTSSTGTFTTLMSEIRKAQQPALDQPCWLDEGLDKPPIESRLRQISKSGGSLICPTPNQVPDEFNLYLTRDGNVGRRCSMTKREGNEIGFKFLSGNVQKSSWLSAILEA
ncbi:MAG TPA: hypothetical protein V6C69_01445 [Trichormus sp.]|jgi:hypothetical protein